MDGDSFKSDIRKMSAQFIYSKIQQQFIRIVWTISKYHQTDIDFSYFEILRFHD